MAESDSGTTWPAIEYLLRGEVLLVVHTVSTGGEAVTRTAVVDMSPMTFLDRGSARKTSTASCTFLEHVAVGLADTITLPNEETARKVIRVTSRFGLTVQADGRLTMVLLK